jgi:hypothetical protein
MSALGTIEAGFDQVSVISRTKAGRRSGSGLHLVTNSGEATTAPSCGSRTGVSAPTASHGRRPAGGQPSSAGLRDSAGQLPYERQQPSARQARFAGQQSRGGQPRSAVRARGRQSAGGEQSSAGQRLPASCVLPPGPLAQPGRREAAPLRLTRRGRLVVGALAVLLATAALTVIATAAAGRAQASNHGRDGAGYQGMHQMVVRPGETLWTIASQAEPSADPRQVIAEIMTVNSMTSTVVQAGELLWVPN